MTSNLATAPLDDYQSEILDRLARSKVFQIFKKCCDINHDSGGPAALELVLRTANYSVQRHKMIISHMGEFTLHDADHLFRMLHLMEWLIPETTLKSFSTPELLLLILSVFFHDIGMAPSEETVNAWLNLKPETFTTEQQAEHQHFSRFLAGRERESAQIALLHKSEHHAEADYILRYLLSDYIRITHAERAVAILEADWNGKIIYRDMNLTPSLAQLCRSHNEDGTKLLELPHLTPAGQLSYICLPFIGVVLRLADILDFDAKRTPKVLFANLFVKHPVSVKEWNKHRAIKNWTITTNQIGFTAECSHPVIEATIKQFCEQIDYELKVCATVMNNLHDNVIQPFPAYYKIPLAAKVDTSRVKAESDLMGNPVYLFRNSAFKLNKEQVISLLMGTKLYGQPQIALRELLQNSIDTCLLRSKLEEKWGNTFVPKISIIFTKQGQEQMLQVIDNGMGMDQYIIDNFYSNIGVSYYKSSEFLELRSLVGANFTPTSRFGIGILSCFMISDQIQVDTRRVHDNHSYGESLSITIEGQESVFYTKVGTDPKPGTTTTLILREDNPWFNKGSHDILAYIKQTIPFPPFEMDIAIDNIRHTHRPPQAAEIDLSDLSPHYNQPNGNIRVFELVFDGSEGIFGKGKIMVIENDSLPVAKFEFHSIPIPIGDEKVSFKSVMSMGENRILLEYEQLDVKKLGTSITKQMTSSYIRDSASKLALHGVEIPVSIFNRWDGDVYQRAKVNWSICAHLNLNITGELDINLNSARNEILIDDQWHRFEDLLIRLILSKIKEQVSVDYWGAFQNLFNDKKFDSSSKFIQLLKSI